MEMLSRIESPVVAAALPDDLSHYLGKKTLVKLILETVPTANGELVRFERLASRPVGLQGPMMLTLLSYCYATGVFGSGDIEQNLQADPMTRYLCARNYPNLDAIRTFRRHHRTEIHRCLATVFRRAWQLRFASDENLGLVQQHHVSVASHLSEMPDFELEADLRLERAIRADSMALDV